VAWQWSHALSALAISWLPFAVPAMLLPLLRLCHPHACEVSGMLLLPVVGGASSYFVAVWAGAQLHTDAEEDSAARRLPQHRLARKLSGGMMALLVALQLALLQVVGAAFRPCGPSEAIGGASHHYPNVHTPARYV
jgi:hypothetical protein